MESCDPPDHNDGSIFIEESTSSSEEHEPNVNKTCSIPNSTTPPVECCTPKTPTSAVLRLSNMSTTTPTKPSSGNPSPTGGRYFKYKKLYEDMKVRYSHQNEILQSVLNENAKLKLEVSQESTAKNKNEEEQKVCLKETHTYKSYFPLHMEKTPMIGVSGK